MYGAEETEDGGHKERNRKRETEKRDQCRQIIKEGDIPRERVTEKPIEQRTDKER